MNQMRTDIELRLADIQLDSQQLCWEPLTTAVASMGAGAASFGAALAFWAAMFRHLP